MDLNGSGCHLRPVATVHNFRIKLNSFSWFGVKKMVESSAKNFFLIVVFRNGSSYSITSLDTSPYVSYWIPTVDQASKQSHCLEIVVPLGSAESGFDLG